MIHSEGKYRGFWWRIARSDTSGHWHAVLSIGDAVGVRHSNHVDRYRLDGNPRYVQDEIDRLVSAGLLNREPVVDEARADKDRLDWLEATMPTINYWDGDTPGERVSIYSFQRDHFGATLREAIDNARGVLTP